MQSDIRWVLGDKICGRPTAADLLEYAEELLADNEEFECCETDNRLPRFNRVRELLKISSDMNRLVMATKEI